MRQLQLAQSAFDSDLPKARCGQMMLVAAVPQQCGDRNGQAGRPRARSERDGYACRAKASCVGGQRTQEKILRQRIAEIIGDESHNRFDPALSLEFLNRFEPKAFSWPMRRQLEDRRAVAGYDDGFAAFNLASKLGQAVSSPRGS